MEFHFVVCGTIKEEKNILKVKSLLNQLSYLGLEIHNEKRDEEE